MRKNIKSYIFIIVIIFLFLIGFYLYHKYFCYTEIFSKNNEFSISIPNKISYKIKDSTEENYFLDFYSIKDEMFFYSNIIEKEDNIDLFEIVNKEKENLISNLQDVNIISDVTQISINNFNAYKYCYSYKDSDYEKDLYAEVVWIETDSKVYILDLEVINNNMKKYKSTFEHIENSLLIQT